MCNHTPFENTGFCIKCGADCRPTQSREIRDKQIDKIFNDDPTTRYEVPDTIRLSDAMYDEFHKKIGFRMVCINQRVKRTEDLTLTFEPSTVSPDTLRGLPRME